MKAWEDAMFNRNSKHWSWFETIFFCLSEVIRKEQLNYGIRMNKKRLMSFLKKDKYGYFFDFNGAKLPDVRLDKEKLNLLNSIFEDVFLVSCYHNDNYESSFIQQIDTIMAEGPYGYINDKFDVTVHQGDVVIDAGAWIGDFSAYAASKGAFSYAFEPSEKTFKWLQKTAMLNGEYISPIPLGLGDKVEILSISTCDINSGGNSLLIERGGNKELVNITTLDHFVKEHNLERVDFVKSDIEGFERNLLMGARETLKKFAPKLAICTYHLPDDPVVLAKIIKDANPNYKIVQMRHKLFAAVM